MYSVQTIDPFFRGILLHPVKWSDFLLHNAQSDTIDFCVCSQCPRTDLSKRTYLDQRLPLHESLSILYRSKITKNQNPPWWVPPYKLLKKRFLLIQKQLYIQYI